MTETILSVGIDLGTTTTQLVFSKLKLENLASAFSVPQLQISGRDILYRSDIHFTPLLSKDTLDTEQIKAIVQEEYDRAGVKPSDIQTGAVIITGETARKENARSVLETLSEFAGKFVVATAGPALESILAARGAGADCYAREHQTYVLHMDIGGGTSNLALYDPQGQLVETGCLNVGGRLLKFDETGVVTYRSTVLDGVDTVSPGERASKEQVKALAEHLVQVLETAAGLRDGKIADAFVTDRLISLPQEPVTISCSGGVAELMRKPESDWLRYGDLGALLADSIRSSRLCQGNYELGQETVQATVVGAGSYSTELSGSTVDFGNVEFPLQDLPVVAISPEEEASGAETLGDVIDRRLQLISGGPAVIAMRGTRSPSYDQLQGLADAICKGVGNEQNPIVVTLQEDMAKALGHAIRARLGSQRGLICLDGLSLQEGSYLDIAAPVVGGTALPVVIKTLAFM